MARSMDPCTSRRKNNSKLEAFLKRNLDVETFEKVRTHEPCIVCSDSENKVFKFVVLTDERIFLTENPPKNISVEKSVSLRDVTHVAILNEYPNFLNGEERENTLHIVVKYKVNEKKKKRTHSNGSNSQDASLANTPREPISTPTVRSLPVFNHSYSDDSITDKNLGDKLGQSLDERAFREKKKLDKKSQSQTSSPIKKNTKSKLKITDPVTMDTNLELRLALENINNNNTSDTINTNLLNTGNSLQIPLSIRSRNNSVNSIRSNASEYSDHAALDPELETPRKVIRTLHLYMPKHNSTLFGMLRNAWRSAVVKSTLEEDEYFKKNLLYSSKSPKVTSQTLETLYCELKSDIFSEDANMEELFYLIIELKNAAERKFTIKKLFWKSQDMFGFIIDQLKLYIPKSEKKQHKSVDLLKSSRADQLEYAILLVDTLHIMLTESDVFPSRISVLQAEGGRYLRDLITLLISTPALPAKHIPPSSKAQLLLNSFDLNKQMVMRDIELSGLDQSFNNSATAILCELLITSRQIMWIGNKQDFLTFSWFVNFLQSLENTNVFLEKSLSYNIGLVSPSRCESLRATEAVLLYRLFTLLAALVQQPDQSTVKFVRKTFYEEFKYYIQAPVIRKKLPYSYAVRSFTLRIMEEVMQEVLQRNVSLS